MDISSWKKSGNQVHKESRVEVVGDNYMPKEDTGVPQAEQEGEELLEHHSQE